MKRKVSIWSGSLGIAPTFLRLDLWSLGAGFIPIISTKGIKSDKERKIVKKVKFCAYIKI